MSVLLYETYVSEKLYMQRSDPRLLPKAFARTQTRQPGPAAAQHPVPVQDAAHPGTMLGEARKPEPARESKALRQNMPRGTTP